MRTIGRRALLAWTLVLGAGSGGCGNNLPTQPEGSPILRGKYSFDVVATFSGDLGVGVRTNGFTLFLDLDARRAIVGGNGRGAVVNLTSVGSRTFRTGAAFAVGGLGDSCATRGDMRYETLEVTVGEGSLTGTARGIVGAIDHHGNSYSSAFTATLMGSPDATAPFLRRSAFGPASQLHPFRLAASEPMPLGATARLVADDGAAIDLVPEVVDGDLPLVVGFREPEIVLSDGHAYDVAVEGLVDFTGHAGIAGVPAPFASFVEAPLVAEDGFESATGEAGGAMVMTGGALPPISGNTSLYIGSGLAPPVGGVGNGPLKVRLARQAGDTKLRFSHRVVWSQTPTVPVAVLWFGSEGASRVPSVDLNPTFEGNEMLTVAGQAATASRVVSTEVALPADATDEVLVVIESLSTCEPSLIPRAGVLIDDLRLE